MALQCSIQILSQTIACQLQHHEVTKTSEFRQHPDIISLCETHSRGQTVLLKCRDLTHFTDAPSPCIPHFCPRLCPLGKSRLQPSSLTRPAPPPPPSLPRVPPPLLQWIPGFSGKASQRRVTAQHPSSLKSSICHQYPEHLWERTASGRGHSYFKLSGVDEIWRDEIWRLSSFTLQGRENFGKATGSDARCAPWWKMSCNWRGGLFILRGLQTPKLSIFKSFPCVF